MVSKPFECTHALPDKMLLISKSFERTHAHREHQSGALDAHMRSEMNLQLLLHIQNHLSAHMRSETDLSCTNNNLHAHMRSESASMVLSMHTCAARRFREI